MNTEEYALRKFVSPEIVYGVGALEKAGGYAVNLGMSKCLIVCDSKVAATGLLDRLHRYLDEHSVRFIDYLDVTPNPKDHETMRGAEHYKSNRCDGIITLGGGSVIDCGKGIGIVVTNQGHICDFEGVDKVKNVLPPLLCIPTTAGSSADISQFVIITDTKRKVKIVIVSKMIVPDVALIDPETTTTMDADLTAATGLDALTHAIEAFVSTASAPITDVHAIEAVRNVVDFLPKVLSDPKNLYYRHRQMHASMQAGLAFSNAILGAVHAMAHSLGGRFDLPHGECNAVLLPHVINCNWPETKEKYFKLAEAFHIPKEDLDPDDSKSFTDPVQTFIQECGVQFGLKDLGIQQEDLPGLAKMALQDPCMVTNPQKLTLGDIIEVFKKAY